MVTATPLLRVSGIEAHYGRIRALRGLRQNSDKGWQERLRSDSVAALAVA